MDEAIGSCLKLRGRWLNLLPYVTIFLDSCHCQRAGKIKKRGKLRLNVKNHHSSPVGNCIFRKTQEQRARIAVTPRGCNDSESGSASEYRHNPGLVSGRSHRSFPFHHCLGHAPRVNPTLVKVENEFIGYVVLCDHCFKSLS